ncbi:hypothetical protein [Lentzea sp. NPDC092896]|uniref:hypothetical protein n=1 Tax=Lentzea sp. NPDC092896 TaxID=3364127 RepID=UPI003804FFDF
MTGYQVVNSAVRKEAAKWDEFASEMGSVRSALSGLALSPLAFFVADAITFAVFPLNLLTPPEELQRSYEDMRSYIEKLAAEAETEFREIGETLIKIADTYERNEEVVELDLDQVY